MVLHLKIAVRREGTHFGGPLCGGHGGVGLVQGELSSS